MSFQRMSRVCCITALCIATHSVAAQRTVAEAPPARPDTRSLDEVLSRRVSIHVTQVSRKRALKEIAANAGILIQYDGHVLDTYQTLVTVQLDSVTLRTALDRVLAGTSLSATTDDLGRLTIVDMNGTGTQQNGRVIVGLIAETKTKRPVVGATVVLDDSVASVRTAADGRYRLTRVTSGQHRVTVRAIGFARQTRIVNVREEGGDEVVTANFSLDASVNTLDQVVVTATGQQRIRELGHVVSVLNVDSLVREAPISSVAELLQSRVPGLQVVTGSGGVAGSAVALSLRGVSSLNLNSAPIIVVDGVRYKSDNMVPQTGSADAVDRNGSYEQVGSPLNDLNVNAIETIEVVKGPSASTLYGPDASNGVIVITTKRGQAGKTRWHWYARPLQNTVPRSEQPVNQSVVVWSHLTSDSITRTPIQGCTLVYAYYNKLCVIDSVVTGPAQLTLPAFATVGSARPTWQYGGDVGGGNGGAAYFASANYTDQQGNIQVPPIVATLVAQQRGIGALSDAVIHPSQLQTLNMHLSGTARPSSRLDVTGLVDYVQTSQHLVDVRAFQDYFASQSLPFGATGILGDSATDQYVLDLIRQGGGDLGLQLANHTSQVQRVSGSLQGTMRFTPWLSASGVAGIDVHDETDHLAQPNASRNTGSVQDWRRNNLGRTFTLNVTATNRARAFSFRSTAGTNYVYNHLDGVTDQGYSVAAGSQSIGLAGQIYANPVWDESAELGVYGQEVVGLADQLFLDVGVRVDGSTRYGDGYHPGVMPKLGMSWIASDAPALRGRLPGISEWRVRGSVGAATRYPTEGMKQGAYSGGFLPIYGVNTLFYLRTVGKNLDLQPEVKHEWEVGTDLTVLDRLQLSVSWWGNTTRNELERLALPTGETPVWANAGQVAVHGTEATLTLPIANLRRVNADVQFSFAHQSSKVLSLGSKSNTNYVVGYPIDAIFNTYALVDVADTVGGSHDGIYENGEAIYADHPIYIGVSNPPTTWTVTPRAGWLGDRIRLSATFDRETGFMSYSQIASTCMSAMTCPAAWDPVTPVLQQALFVTGQPVYERGDFTRWRELNVTVDLPTRWLRVPAVGFGVSGASVSVQGRNLALWTRYPGDPESIYGTVQLGNTSRGGIPQNRSWGLRVDVTP